MSTKQQLKAHFDRMRKEKDEEEREIKEQQNVIVQRILNLLKLDKPKPLTDEEIDDYREYLRELRRIKIK